MLLPRPEDRRQVMGYGWGWKREESYLVGGGEADCWGGREHSSSGRD